MRVTAVVREESQPFEIEEIELEEPGAGEAFIPRLVELYTQGRFPFDRLIRSYSLEEINQAAKDAEEGNTLKRVLCME